MKIFLRKLVIILLAASVVVSLLPHTVYASENFLSGDTVHLTSDKTITTDYYAAGATNVVDGTINGDAYLAGGTVVVNGTVFGDVLVAGGNISINGKVAGNVRAVGGQIVITGEVDRNVTVAGGSVTIQKPALVHGSLTNASGNLSILAPVEKGAVIAGGQVSINSVIGGDVRASVEQLNVMQNADINGELQYWSSNQAHIVPFTIKNNATYHKTEIKAKNYKGPTPQQVGKAVMSFGIFMFLVNLAIAFAIGVFLLRLVPVFMQSVRTTITEDTLTSLFIGLIAVILLPFAAFVLLVSVVGIPFVFLLGAIFILILLANQIFVGYAIGKKILPQRNELALLLGLIIYEVASAVPIIGWMFSSIALFIGLGALIVVKKKLYTSLHSKKLI